jgi:NADH dehydrogenase [ubiquinone] 1 alpha subcomplex assembly factor 7
MEAPETQSQRCEDGEGTPLASILRARIRETGPLPLAEFMQACLHDPEHGYYRKRQPLGALGDFTTAPEISQMFGEIIGAWAAVVGDVLRGAAPDEPLRLIELGPGRGTLIVDVLRVVATQLRLSQSLTLHLVEQNETLRTLQKSALDGTGHPPSFHDRLEDVPSGPTILIANEFLDCLPINQLVRQDGAWRMRCVGLDQHGAFEFQRGDDAQPELNQMPDGDTDEGAILEYCPGLASTIASLASRLRAAPGLALIIDYGTSETCYGDTLQAIRTHGHADPLSRPGDTDVTAHVNFAELGALARLNGLNVYGPLPQARFLTELGLVQRLAQRMQGADAATRNQLEIEAARLAAPGAMGNVFKVMVLASPHIGPPPPFELPSGPETGLES